MEKDKYDLEDAPQPPELNGWEEVATMARYYVHTPEHQAEEFEQYERPLHEYMDKYCPKASAVLKTERTENDKTYRWL